MERINGYSFFVTLYSEHYDMHGDQMYQVYDMDTISEVYEFLARKWFNNIDPGDSYEVTTTIWNAAAKEFQEVVLERGYNCKVF